MASVNKVILIGNLGKDPELRVTGGGASVCHFPVATSERWKNKDTGNWDERTDWHNIVVWGRQAETCKEYLAKGRTCYIEGRLQTRNYEDKEGNKKYITEVIAQNVRFLGGRRDEGASMGGGVGAATSASAAAILWNAVLTASLSFLSLKCLASA